MRPQACRSLVVLLLAGGAAACEGKRVVDTGPTGPAPGPPAPTGTVQIRVEGRVSDFDNDGGLAAVVRLVGVITDPQHSSRAVDEPAGTTSDEHGGFSFTANVPADWTQLSLSATRDGYDVGRGWVGRTSLSAGHLPMYRIHKIRPGQSIEMRVGAELDNCFDDGFPCRRVFVEVPSGEKVDLEVTATDSQAMVGLDVWAETHRFGPPRWERHLTVAGGEVWVYGITPALGLPLRGQLTLTATRH